ncbi:MAG: hypothetical protein HQL04_00680 [Nitrospirae bacterium]|nr:hypothetical protein [Nitrospirota bacterium]
MLALLLPVGAVLAQDVNDSVIEEHLLRTQRVLDEASDGGWLSPKQTRNFQRRIDNVRADTERRERSKRFLRHEEREQLSSKLDNIIRDIDALTDRPSLPHVVIPPVKLPQLPQPPPVRVQPLPPVFEPDRPQPLPRHEQPPRHEVPIPPPATELQPPVKPINPPPPSVVLPPPVKSTPPPVVQTPPPARPTPPPATPPPHQVNIPTPPPQSSKPTPSVPRFTPPPLSLPPGH